MAVNTGWVENAWRAVHAAQLLLVQSRCTHTDKDNERSTHTVLADSSTRWKHCCKRRIPSFRITPSRALSRCSPSLSHTCSLTLTPDLYFLCIIIISRLHRSSVQRTRTHTTSPLRYLPCSSVHTGGHSARSLRSTPPSSAAHTWLPQLHTTPPASSPQSSVRSVQFVQQPTLTQAVMSRKE